MYKVRGNIILRDTVRSGYAVSKLIRALGLERLDEDIEKYLSIDCHPEEFDEKAVLSALDDIAIFACGGCVYVTEPDVQEEGVEGGNTWRYTYDVRKESFVRMNARVVWEKDPTGDYRGRGLLKVIGDPVETADALGSLFSSVSIRNDGNIAVSYNGPDFDPEYTTSSLKSVAGYVQSGTICIGRTDDGPDMGGVARWKFIFHDGQLTCKWATDMKWQ